MCEQRVQQQVATFDNLFAYHGGEYVRVLAIRDTGVWETQFLIAPPSGAATWVQAKELYFIPGGA